MNILFLGGTTFVGRHMVEVALSRGHQVSIFSRGKTNATLFPEATHLIGDRDKSLDLLRGKYWDAVVDVCGYFPRQVRASASLLQGNVGHYAFVSSMSVYDYTQSDPILDESASLITLDNPATELIDSEWVYGGNKVLCEKAISKIMPDNVLHLRPTFVAGPYDLSGRFTYWINRVAKGGDVAVPANPEQPIQWVDVRDLADFTVTSVEQRIKGAINIAGPSSTWASWLNACRDILESNANFVWLKDEGFLREFAGLKGITSSMFPFCMDKKYAVARCSLTAEKARNLFFISRRISETVKDTLSWDKRQVKCPDTDSMMSKREIELLEQYKKWSGRMR